MANYEIGDEVLCNVNDSDDSEVKHIKHVKLQVISHGKGYDSHQLLCYVPPYINVKASFVLLSHHLKQYKFNSKFLGEYGTFVNHVDVIKHEPAIPAQQCSNCKGLIHYAEKPESGDYWCQACKDNPWRR